MSVWVIWGKVSEFEMGLGGGVGKLGFCLIVWSVRLRNVDCVLRVGSYWSLLGWGS